MPVRSGIAQLRQSARALADPERAKFFQKFFKTGPGEYAEGDTFIGLTVPQVRALAKQCTTLLLSELVALLKSPVHEERLLALLLLTHRFQKGDPKERQKIFDLYLKNRKYINNWDLVDSSADKIVGRFLEDRPRKILDELARSADLWDRRIAIISTFHFIRAGQFSDTLRIARLLLNDKHDLIHKAVGWMLREVGKRDQSLEQEFLRKHYRVMPRTMLRYAIERFPESVRRQYLSGTV